MATPQTDPSTWLGGNDYPASAIASDKEGAATVALEVDETGRATACAVTSSSGSAALDDRTCALLMERARFSPARDEAGKAVRSTYVQRVAWQIPREELITQGFRLSYAVAPNGDLSDCRIERFHDEDGDLQCNPRMIESAVDAYLPSPLVTYKSASIMLAMEVDNSGIAISRKLEEDRTVISRALIDVSAAGVITGCRSEVARPFMGQSADLCVMAVEVGGREFAPDPAGKERTFSVTLEVSGQRR